MRKIIVVFILLSIVSCQKKEKVAPQKSEKAQEEVASPNLYDLGVYVVDIEKSKEFYTTVFDLKVVREWNSIDLSFDDETYMTVPLHGLYLEGDNSMHLELIEKANPENRQVIQQPINHFAIKVNDVRDTYKKALAMGAKPAFKDERLQYAKIGDLKVLNTQIIGIDGERIQILEVLEK